MIRYKIIIEYDGLDFVGWQSQDNGISIQESIEKACKKLFKEKVMLFGARRTDAGVHAKGQVAHFDVSKEMQLDNIRDGLNQYLRPLPIAILEAKEVKEDFHARFSAKLRTYEYLVINRRPPLTIERNKAWCVYSKLNKEEMTQASKLFEGRHDFSSFRSVNCQSNSSIKTINKCQIHFKSEFISILVTAKSFLHSQVRIIVGTLIDVGRGKIFSEDIKKIIEGKDRSKAGSTAPPYGLYLLKVDY